MSRVEFVWDGAKARLNLGKHGISFEAAKFAFDDPDAVHEQDQVVGGEARWRVIGRVGLFTVLIVAYTTWDEIDGTEVYRIISARRATRTERLEYEEAP